jgi:hypothetical protein
MIRHGYMTNMNFASAGCFRRIEPMKRRYLSWSAAIVTLVFVANVYAGGWVIVSVENLPEYAVAGKPFRLSFTVRDVGGSPLGGLNPTVSAKSGTKIVWAPVVAASHDGEYTALSFCHDLEAGQSGSMHSTVLPRGRATRFQSSR